jgi:hypothetical protein
LRIEVLRIEVLRIEVLRIEDRGLRIDFKTYSNLSNRKRIEERLKPLSSILYPLPLYPAFEVRLKTCAGFKPLSSIPLSCL